MMRNFKYSTRLNSFKARPDLYSWRKGPSDVLELIGRANLVPELDTLELNYPEHFNTYSVEDIKEFLGKTHLSVSGINLRYPDSEFCDGVFTNPSPAKRARAVEITCQAMDVCAALHGHHIVIWPAQDGFDYPFQLDYGAAWSWTVEALRQITSYRPEIQVSFEYKPMEPRRFSLCGNFGMTMALIAECNVPNLGITVDFCHSLMAREYPPLAVGIALRKGILHGIHLNDGHGQHDDGLMVGSIHTTQTLELLFQLIRENYQGVIYFDTFPQREDPVTECSINITRVNQLVKLLSTLDHRELEDAIQQQNAIAVSQLIWEAVFSSEERRGCYCR